MLQLWSLQPQHITSNRRCVGERAAAKSSWLTPSERTHDSVKVLWPKSAFMNFSLNGLGWECASFKLSFCLLTSFLSQHNNSESASSKKQQGLAWFLILIVIGPGWTSLRLRERKGPWAVCDWCCQFYTIRTARENEQRTSVNRTHLRSSVRARIPACCKNSAPN